MAHAARLIAIGIVLGTAAALAGARAIEAMLFEISPRDPFTFVAITLFFAAVAAQPRSIRSSRCARSDSQHKPPFQL